MKTNSIIKVLVLIIGFMPGLLFGNGINKEWSLMDSLKVQMGKNLIPEKESPFFIRETKDTLEGKWLGHAISYGAYREGQAPGAKGPSKEQILEDLMIIKKYWNLIRVYGSDKDSENILQVIKENKLPIKVMLGIWLENEVKDGSKREANIKQALKGIELANKYKEQIFAVSVGNESQVFWSWHKMEMQNLIKYIRYVRNNTSVPVTVADDYNFWNKEESKNVSSEIDFIVCHAYPLWNSQTLSNSIPWLDAVLKDVMNLQKDKKIVLGEIGWATNYNSNKKGPGEQGTLIKGEVSISAQEEFLKKLYEWTNNNKIITFWFEAFDEPWKGGGELSGHEEIEKNWGLFYENRKPKESFRNFVNEYLIDKK